MNNEAIARQAIDQKWQALKSQGLDLGSRKGTLKSVGYGGYCQEYQHGRIYWHKDEGAHEVHGGILDEYLRLGGPGVHPETGRCELGFPKGDEQKWTFGYDRFPVSFFQKGVIYWVRGAGAVSIYGDFHDYYNNVSIQKNYPITGHIAIASGEAIYFDNRCFYKGLETDDEIIEIHLPGGFFSGIGHPLIMHPTIPISVNFDVRYLKGTWDNIRKKLPTLIQQLWQNRLFLQRVGFPTEMVALNLENENRFNVRDLLAGGEYVTMSGSDRKSGSSYTIQFMRKQWLDRDLTHIGKIPDDLPPYPPPPDPRGEPARAAAGFPCPRSPPA